MSCSGSQHLILFIMWLGKIWGCCISHCSILCKIYVFRGKMVTNYVFGNPHLFSGLILFWDVILVFKCTHGDLEYVLLVTRRFLMPSQAHVNFSRLHRFFDIFMFTCLQSFNIIWHEIWGIALKKKKILVSHATAWLTNHAVAQTGSGPKMALTLSSMRPHGIIPCGRMVY